MTVGAAHCQHYNYIVTLNHHRILQRENITITDSKLIITGTWRIESCFQMFVLENVCRIIIHIL